MALLKYLLPIYFVTLAFGEILKLRIYPTVSAGVIDLIIALILFVWIFFVKKTKYSLRNSILIFASIALVTLLINIPNFAPNQISVASLYLVRFILYAGIYFVFVDIGKKYKDVIPKYMLFTGLIFITLGFLQYFLFPSLIPYYHLGWDMHTYRIFSTFLDPNFAGAFLVLILVFAYILREKIFPKRYPILFYLFILFNLIAIILSYSRGAMLMLLACVLTYSAITRNWKLTGGLVVSFVLVFFILSPQFKFESTNLLRFASIEARISSTETALNVWKENPMGVGFNTYRYAREKYGEVNDYIYGPSHAGAGVDNSFILVLVTTGVVGLIAYLYMISRMFKIGYGSIKKNKFALVLVVSLVGIIINSFTINSLFYSFILLWIFTLAGFTESSLRE